MVSLTAVSLAVLSPGCIFPPGNAICPDHGSPARSARLMSNTLVDSLLRSMMETAANLRPLDFGSWVVRFLATLLIISLFKSVILRWAPNFKYASRSAEGEANMETSNEKGHAESLVTLTEANFDQLT